MNADERRTRGNDPLDPECEVMITSLPRQVGDLVQNGAHRYRVVRILSPTAILIRPRRWYDRIAIAIQRLGLAR